MNYLLDTDVIVNHLRGREKLNKKIAKENLAISILTFGELLYGAYKSSNKDSTIQLVQNFIQDFSIEIITLDKKIMYIYAQIKSELEMAGQKLDDFDLLIGATATNSSYALVTQNIRHFQRIPNLRIF